MKPGEGVLAGNVNDAGAAAGFRFDAVGAAAGQLEGLNGFLAIVEPLVELVANGAGEMGDFTVAAHWAARRGCGQRRS